MNVEEYVIQPKEGAKGRSFSATCVAFATADGLWECSGNTIRPAWAMFAGSEGELRPFVTNLRLGRKAERLSNRHRGGDDERLEFLKSVGYHITWQREREGVIATLYHPDLFKLDPGMVDPDGIKFVLLVPSDWSEAQGIGNGPEGAAAVAHVQAALGEAQAASDAAWAQRLQEARDAGVEGWDLPRRQTDYRAEARAKKLDFDFLSSLVPTAYLFAAFLDRRTRVPLVADGRFYMQLLIAALDCGFASLPGNNARHNSGRDEWGQNSRHGFNVEIGGVSYSRAGLETVGLKHGFSFSASHEAFEAFVAEQVVSFFERVGEMKAVTEEIDFSEFCEAVFAAPDTGCLPL